MDKKEVFILILLWNISYGIEKQKPNILYTNNPTECRVPVECPLSDC